MSEANEPTGTPEPADVSALRGAELYDAVLAHIEANPWQWRQSTYGEREDGVMVGCFAFLAVLLVDGPDAFTREGTYYDDSESVDVVVLNGCASEHQEHSRDGEECDEHEVRSVTTRAIELLNITWSQATFSPGVFSGYQRVEDLAAYRSTLYPTKD